MRSYPSAANPAEVPPTRKLRKKPHTHFRIHPSASLNFKSRFPCPKRFQPISLSCSFSVLMPAKRQLHLKSLEHIERLRCRWPVVRGMLANCTTNYMHIFRMSSFTASEIV